MSYKALSAIKEHVEIETIKNLSPQQVNEVFNKQAARIKELEDKYIVSCANLGATIREHSKLTEQNEALKAENEAYKNAMPKDYILQYIAQKQYKQINDARLAMEEKNKELRAENERLKELMSGLVHWNNQGHIDQSFWDAAAQLTDPTMG